MKLPIVRLLIALSATAAGASQPLDGFAVAPGLEASLYAGTEEISSPVSIDVDDRGRVWVFETVNYRKKTRSTGDRILILEDTNGDGHADSQKLFYEGSDINGGSGICVLGNRVIVSAPDRILMLIDTDGDDKSDTKNLLFQAPVTKKWSVAGQHDHALHSFQFGPDGRLYFNFGDATEKLRDADNKIVVDRHGYPVVAAAGFLRAGRKPGEYTNEQPMGGMVLRCELDGSNIEVLGHNFRNNWEVTADSFGSLWQSDNDNGSSSCRVNFVMEYGNFGYLDEMSGAVYKVHRTNMSPNIKRSMWHQNDPGVVPNMLITGSGAPAGIQVYEGDLLPAQYRNQILLAEPYRNALWSIPVTQRGAGYSAKIVNVLQTPKSKLFRPCDISIAPDGSLFVADWFDPIVCCHKGKDDRGRIYRVAPNGHKYVPSTFDYKTATGAIVALRSPNLAARYKAWTALTAMGRTARPDLEKIITEDANPRVRARALWLLAAIDRDSSAAAKLAMSDKDENVRAMTLRMVRRHKQDSAAYVQMLMSDTSAVVRRECIIALRHQAPTTQKATQWAILAGFYEGKDRWYLEALGIGAFGHEEACLAAWRKRVGADWKTAVGQDLVWRSRAAAAVPLLVQLLSDKAVPESEHLRLMRAFDFHDQSIVKPALLEIVKNGAAGTSPIAYLEAVSRLEPEQIQSKATVMAELPEVLLRCTDQALAVKLVNRYGLHKLFTPRLIKVAAEQPSSKTGIDAINQVLLMDGKSTIVAAAAKPQTVTVLDALGFAGTKETTDLLLALMVNQRMSMNIRRRAMHGLPKSNRGTQTLLAHLKKKTLSNALGDEGIKLLLVSTDSKARAWARNALGIETSSDPMEKLSKLMGIRANPGAGQAAFTKTGCMGCHKVGKMGLEYGPDLSTVGSLMAKPELFGAILAPSYSIKFGYEGETISLNNGTTLIGFVSGENDTSINLRLPGGVAQQLAKNKIKSRKKLEQSLMPSGLDAALTNQELADMVGWLLEQKVKENDESAQ